MSDLIAVAFDDPHEAEAVRLDLMKKEREDLVDLEEAVVLVRDKNDKVHFRHSAHYTMPGALTGGFVGTLVGLMVINPILALIGGVAGTGVGAVLGALKEVGVDEDFMKDLAEGLTIGSSALFVVVRRGNPEALTEALESSGGKVLQTSLSHQDEARLKAVLDQVWSKKPEG